MLVTTTTALTSAVDQDLQAVITSAGFAFRSTGSVIGLTIASAAFQNLLRLRLQHNIGSIEGADNIIDRIRNDFDEINRLDQTIVGGVKQSYMEALRGASLTTCGLSVLAALCSLLMKQHKLHVNFARR